MASLVVPPVVRPSQPHNIGANVTSSTQKPANRGIRFGRRNAEAVRTPCLAECILTCSLLLSLYTGRGRTVRTPASPHYNRRPTATVNPISRAIQYRGQSNITETISGFQCPRAAASRTKSAARFSVCELYNCKKRTCTSNTRLNEGKDDRCGNRSNEEPEASGRIAIEVAGFGHDRVPLSI